LIGLLKAIDQSLIFEGVPKVLIEAFRETKGKGSRELISEVRKLGFELSLTSGQVDSEKFNR
jgi:hypothetical protein